MVWSSTILNPPRLLLVTGLSGAGKSTVLKSLEDLGWEVVDNLPLSLLRPLISAPAEGQGPIPPVAVGIDSRSRGFQPSELIKLIDDIRDEGGRQVESLFVDCAATELERRFSETRRRHPMAYDRPAADGIEREREYMASLRGWADQLIDTTNHAAMDLQQEVRHRFGRSDDHQPTLNILSFGFSRGVPRNADLVFDMRYLRNPHWDLSLRPGTGKDQAVADYIRADPAYESTVSQIEKLLLELLPRYQAEGKSYVTIAIGCTGGRHRSVHVAERLTQTLLSAGHKPILTHRNLDLSSKYGLEHKPLPSSPNNGEQEIRSAPHAHG